MYLSFFCGVQFNLTSFFHFENKINLIFSTSTLLFLFLYSFSFYSLILKYFNIKSAKILLQRLIYRSYSFIIEPVYIVARTLVRSLITGIFIRTYKYQLLGLLSSDILLFITVVLTK